MRWRLRLFCRCRAASRVPCSALPPASARTSEVAAFWCARRSRRAILPPWRALRVRTSAASSKNGRASRACRALRATTALRTRPRSSARPSCKNELKDSWTSSLGLATQALRQLRRQTESLRHQLAEGDEVNLSRRGLPPNKADSAARLRRRKPQKLDALVPHLDIDRDLRHERDTVAVRHHLHHGREARRSQSHRTAMSAVAAVGERLVTQAMTFLEQDQ